MLIPEVGDAQVSLLAVAQVRLGDKDVAHGEHTQATNLLGAVKDDRWEPAGHLTVQPNLDTLQESKAAQCPVDNVILTQNSALRGPKSQQSGTATHCTGSKLGEKQQMASWQGQCRAYMDAYCLDLVLTLDQQVQQLLGVHSSLPVVGHQPNQGCVPLVGNLGESGAATAHQDLPDTVFKLLESLIIHPQESLQAVCIEHSADKAALQLANCRILISKKINYHEVVYCTHGGCKPDGEAAANKIQQRQRTALSATRRCTHQGPAGEYVPVQCAPL